MPISFSPREKVRMRGNVIDVSPHRNYFGISNKAG